MGKRKIRRNKGPSKSNPRRPAADTNRNKKNNSQQSAVPRESQITYFAAQYPFVGLERFREEQSKTIPSWKNYAATKFPFLKGGERLCGRVTVRGQKILQNVYASARFCKKLEIRDFGKHGRIVCTAEPARKGERACIMPGEVCTAKKMTLAIEEELFKFVHENGSVTYIKSNSREVSIADLIGVCQTKDERRELFEPTCDENVIAEPNLEVRCITLNPPNRSSVKVLALYFTEDMPAGQTLGCVPKQYPPSNDDAMEIKQAEIRKLLFPGEPRVPLKYKLGFPMPGEVQNPQIALVIPMNVSTECKVRPRERHVEMMRARVPGHELSKLLRLPGDFPWDLFCTQSVMVGAYKNSFIFAGVQDRRVSFIVNADGIKRQFTEGSPVIRVAESDIMFSDAVIKVQLSLLDEFVPRNIGDVASIPDKWTRDFEKKGIWNSPSGRWWLDPKQNKARMYFNLDDKRIQKARNVLNENFTMAREYGGKEKLTCNITRKQGDFRVLELDWSNARSNAAFMMQLISIMCMLRESAISLKRQQYCLGYRLRMFEKRAVFKIPPAFEILIVRLGKGRYVFVHEKTADTEQATEDKKQEFLTISDEAAIKMLDEIAEKRGKTTKGEYCLTMKDYLEVIYVAHKDQALRAAIEFQQKHLADELHHSANGRVVCHAVSLRKLKRRILKPGNSAIYSITPAAMYGLPEEHHRRLELFYRCCKQMHQVSWNTWQKYRAQSKTDLRTDESMMYLNIIELSSWMVADALHQSVMLLGAVVREHPVEQQICQCLMIPELLSYFQYGLVKKGKIDKIKDWQKDAEYWVEYEAKLKNLQSSETFKKYVQLVSRRRDREISRKRLKNVSDLLVGFAKFLGVPGKFYEKKMKDESIGVYSLSRVDQKFFETLQKHERNSGWSPFEAALSAVFQ